MSEQQTPPEQHAAWEELIEIVEVILLALVAIATAWSGYQAARWDGQQSLLYGTASADRFQPTRPPPPGPNTAGRDRG